jgi:hypothetical protein
MVIAYCNVFATESNNKENGILVRFDRVTICLHYNEEALHKMRKETADWKA